MIGPILVWGFAIAALARVQFRAHEWTFASLADATSPMLSRAARQRIAALDAPRNRGSSPRWWIHYNLLTLRMISFGMDLHWRRLETSDDGDDDAEPGDHRSLVSRPRREVRYSLGEYLAYVTYPPLYLAGPTCTFNAFASQLRRPLGAGCVALRGRSVARYFAAKFAGSCSSSRCGRTPSTRTPCASRGCGGGGAGGGVRRVRAVRGWRAVPDGAQLHVAEVHRHLEVLPAVGARVRGGGPENMLRCINNNATILGFWKGWHASYNRWLVRYITSRSREIQAPERVGGVRVCRRVA